MMITRDTKKNLVLALASALLSLVIFAALIEAFLNLKYESWKSHYATDGDWFGGLTTVSANPVLMWEYRPNAESSGLSSKIRTNRYGFRDKDYESPAKPGGVYRISFIGDSVTLGLKVDSQDIFTSKFSTYAAEQYPNLGIESTNHGIDGYNAIQIFELLKSRILQFEPDEIVYVMCLNDFDFEESSGDKIRYFNKPDSFILEKLQAIYRDLLGIDFHQWHFNKNKQQVFNTLLEMQQLLASRNIDFHIAILPVFRFTDPDKSFASYPLSEIHFEISQFLIEQDIHSIDLLESFKNENKPPKYFAHDIWHPNKEGHEVIATRLLQFLFRNTPVPYHDRNRLRTTR